MRIGVVIEVPFPPNFRKQLRLFGELLPYTVDVISPLGTFNVEDVDELSNRSKRLMYPSLFLNLCRYIYRYKPHVLMNFSGPMVVVPLMVAAGGLFRVPVIARLPGNTFGEYRFSKGWRRWFYYFFRNILGKLSLRFASKIVVMGPFERERLVKSFPEDKVHVIPPLIDSNTNNMEKEESKRSLGLEGLKVILFVGRLSRRKGADKLNRIVGEVGKQRKDIVFCVVGDGEYREELAELENPKCVGEFGSEEMSRYYASADLLVHPSRVEGLPNVVLEALSHRVPVV
ncbi:MAG: glycosyltransferase, partial [Archaeoglobaceae archaeon]